MGAYDPWPGDIDPAELTGVLRAALRAALDSRARLELPTLSEQDLDEIRQAIAHQVLPALTNEALWRALAQQEREQAQAAAERSRTSSEQPSPLLSALAGELLSDANRRSPDAVLGGGLSPLPPDTIARGVHLQVQVFVNTVSAFTDQPVPAADDPGRPAWVQGIKWALDKTVDILVAATFAVNAVQLAAERAVSETVAAAGHALEYAGQAWPSLVALGVVALQAAVGVGLVKQAWEAVRSARAEVVSPGHLERDPAPVSHPQQEAAEKRREVTPTTLQAGRHAEEPPPGPGQPATTTRHVVDQAWDTGATDRGARKAVIQSPQAEAVIQSPQAEAVIQSPQGEVVLPPLPEVRAGTLPAGKPVSGAREERDASAAAEAADSR